MKKCFALLAALLLASCGKGPAARQVNVYVWTNYLPKEVVEDFQRRTGITVNVDTYDSNEAVLAKLQSGVADYDVVVPSDYMLKTLIPQGLVRPLDRARLTHFNGLGRINSGGPMAAGIARGRSTSSNMPDPAMRALGDRKSSFTSRPRTFSCRYAIGLAASSRRRSSTR